MPLQVFTGDDAKRLGVAVIEDQCAYVFTDKKSHPDEIRRYNHAVNNVVFVLTGTEHQIFNALQITRHVRTMLTIAGKTFEYNRTRKTYDDHDKDSALNGLDAMEMFTSCKGKLWTYVFVGPLQDATADATT